MSLLVVDDHAGLQEALDAWSWVRVQRRTKTQTSFGPEASAGTLLYELVAFGQVRSHKIHGHRELKAWVAKMNVQVS